MNPQTPRDWQVTQLVENVAIALFDQDRPQSRWEQALPEMRNWYRDEAADLCSTTITALFGEHSTR